MLHQFSCESRVSLITLTKYRILFPIVATFLCLPGNLHVYAAPLPAPIVIQIPSEMPSGNIANDEIWVTYYRAASSTSPTPAVILLHPIGIRKGDFTDRYMHRLGQRMAMEGINSAVVMMPWHAQRAMPHSKPLDYYIGRDVARDIESLRQGVSDVKTVTNWLVKRPEVDSRRIGIVGISLGAIILHLAMGQDSRLSAGVALEGGGDLASLYRNSAEIALNGHPNDVPLSESQLERLASVDPASNADQNRPRRVLMIQAARDLNVPPSNAIYLWNALGRPPIQWIDTNHYAFILAGKSLVKTAVAYLNGVWNGKSDSAIHAPQFRPPTIKFGWLFEMTGYTSPAIQWQFYSFASRPDHMSLVHLDLGESGRGPFLGLAATINLFVDMGIDQRITGRPLQPYVSLHLVF